MTIPPDQVVDLSGSVQFAAPDSIRGIGVVAPFDFALDDEYWRWLGAGTSLYVTRTPYLDIPVSVGMAEAVSSLDDVGTGAASLRIARPASVLYACTSGSFVGGLAGERAIRDRLSEAAQAPAVTTSGALLEALDLLGVRRIAVGTPYDAEVTARLGDFLAEAGVDVVRCAYLGLHADIAHVDGHTVRRLVVAADTEQAEAVFLSCTNLRTFDLLASLESELGKPVLSANQVSMWAALRAGSLPAAYVDQRLFRAGGTVMSQ